MTYASICLPSREGRRAPWPARTLCLFVIALLLGTASTLRAATVTATWDQNPEPDIAGYILSYGTQSGEYTTFDVGNVTSWPLTLTEGRRWYFAVQAYNTSGLISDLSGEVFYDVSSSAAQLTTPVPGSTVTATSVQFQWTSGTNATDYWLSVGTASGGADLWDHDEGTSLSEVVTGLPTDGSTVYVRLSSLIGDAWQLNDYWYTATTAAGEPATVTTPTPGSSLTDTSVLFEWTSGTAVSQYGLSVGTTVGGADLFNQDEGMGLSDTVTGLPNDGSTVYVRLWSLIGGGWQFNDYAYTATTAAGGPAKSPISHAAQHPRVQRLAPARPRVPSPGLF